MINSIEPEEINKENISPTISCLSPTTKNTSQNQVQASPLKNLVDNDPTFDEISTMVEQVWEKAKIAGRTINRSNGTKTIPIAWFKKHIEDHLPTEEENYRFQQALENKICQSKMANKRLTKAEVYNFLKAMETTQNFDISLLSLNPNDMNSSKSHSQLTGSDDNVSDLKNQSAYQDLVNEHEIEYQPIHRRRDYNLRDMLREKRASQRSDQNPVLITSALEDDPTVGNEYESQDDGLSQYLIDRDALVRDNDSIISATTLPSSAITAGTFQTKITNIQKTLLEDRVQELEIALKHLEKEKLDWIDKKIMYQTENLSLKTKLSDSQEVFRSSENSLKLQIEKLNSDCQLKNVENENLKLSNKILKDTGAKLENKIAELEEENLKNFQINNDNAVQNEKLVVENSGLEKLVIDLKDKIDDLELYIIKHQKSVNSSQDSCSNNLGDILSRVQLSGDRKNSISDENLTIQQIMANIEQSTKQGDNLGDYFKTPLKKIFGRCSRYVSRNLIKPSMEEKIDENKSETYPEPTKSATRSQEDNDIVDPSNSNQEIQVTEAEIKLNKKLSESVEQERKTKEKLILLLEIYQRLNKYCDKVKFQKKMYQYGFFGVLVLATVIGFYLLLLGAICFKDDLVRMGILKETYVGFSY